MCLKTITGVVTRPSNRKRVGYKVMYLYGQDVNTVYLPYFYHQVKFGEQTLSTRKMELGIWYTARNETVYLQVWRGKGPESYKSGFHLFTNKKDARKYLAHLHGKQGVIVKVNYTHLTFIGTQTVYTKNRFEDIVCHVANRIQLLEVVKETGK